MKITFLDMEFANTKSKSICQIGILCRDIDDPEKPAETRNLYINPEEPFEKNCVLVHHIDENAVKAAPNLKTAWSDLEKYFTNAIVVGHNVVQKNLDALYHNLLRYHIEIPTIYYLCTYHCAQKHLSPFLVSDYALDTLCQHYHIPLQTRHQAFNNACAISDLFDCLMKEVKIPFQEEIRLFLPQEDRSVFGYLTNSGLSGDIHNFYGVIKGFTMDGDISDDEITSLKEWSNFFNSYQYIPYIKDILETIDQIIEDNIITADEIRRLQIQIRKYLNVNETSVATLATHILGGLIKGIVTDDEVTEEECLRLRDWLYDNYFLSGHFPFDRMFQKIEEVLEDNVLTKDEAKSIKEEIQFLLEPTEKLKKELLTLKEKRVSLIGYDSSDQKFAVEQYVIGQGGIISADVENSDYIVVKDQNGTKPNSFENTGKKLNNSNTQFIKESDLIIPSKSFSDVLFDFIDMRGMGDAEVYKKARLPRQMMSKIKCQPDYRPEKKNICSFAIALELDLEQTNTLLSSAGYILSPSLAFDRVIQKSISHRNYNIDSINESLYDIGAPVLA